MLALILEKSHHPSQKDVGERELDRGQKAKISLRRQCGGIKYSHRGEKEASQMRISYGGSDHFEASREQEKDRPRLVVEGPGGENAGERTSERKVGKKRKDTKRSHLNPDGDTKRKLLLLRNMGGKTGGGKKKEKIEFGRVDQNCSYPWPGRGTKEARNLVSQKVSSKVGKNPSKETGGKGRGLIRSARCARAAPGAFGVVGSWERTEFNGSSSVGRQCRKQISSKTLCVGANPS